MFFSASLIAYLGLFSYLASAIPIPEVPFVEPIFKGLRKPPVPTSEQLKPHISDPKEGTCMFYTGGTYRAAAQYAKLTDKVILAFVNEDGWTAPSVTGQDGKPDYADDCPLSRRFQEPYVEAGIGWTQIDVNQYWDNLSQAFAEKCTGDVFLAVNGNLELPPNSVFIRIEWPTINSNTEIDRLYWAAFDVTSNAQLTGVNLGWSRFGVGVGDLL